MCTWYGFSFDYATATDVKIRCEYSVSEPLQTGNPRKELGLMQSDSFELELKQGQHHFFLAQYIAGEKDGASSVEGKEACGYHGQSLFDAKFQYQFTNKEAPVESVPDMNTSR